MTKFDEEIKRREEVGNRYTSLLKDVKGIKTPVIKDSNTCVFAQYTIVVENRDELQAKLKEKAFPQRCIIQFRSISSLYSRT